MPKRIILDSAYLARIKKEDDAIAASLSALVRRKVPCKYCQCRTIDKFEDLKKGHFQRSAIVVVRLVYTKPPTTDIIHI